MITYTKKHMPDFQYVSSFRQELARGHSCALHWHDQIEIVYHYSGKGWTTDGDGRKYSFAPGTVIIYQPGVGHSQYMTESGDDYCLIVKASDHDTRYTAPVESIRKVRSDYIIQELEALTALSIPRSADREILDLRVSALMAALIQEWREAGTEEQMGQGDWYAYEARRLCRQVGEFGTVKAIAAELNISGEYLRHLFQDKFGCSMKSYIVSQRIKRARDLLSLSNMPLKHIAEQCGYSSEGYFCTAFKKATGMTPGECR